MVETDERLGTDEKSEDEVEVGDDGCSVGDVTEGVGVETTGAARLRRRCSLTDVATDGGLVAEELEERECSTGRPVESFSKGMKNGAKAVVADAEKGREVWLADK